MRSTIFLTLLLACLPAFGCTGANTDTNVNAKAAPADAPPPAPEPDPSAPSTASTAGMIRIPAGEFVFGATEQQFQAFLATSLVSFPGMREKIRQYFIIPPRTVNLPEFHIDQFEVTNKQYLEFVQATRYTPADSSNYLSHWESPDRYPAWAEEFPVVWISQEDAKAYCAWRKGALPTEEQWEKAARSTDGRVMPWGDQAPTTDTANLTSGKIEPTGNRSEDRSAYDVYDLAGNVGEITSGTLGEGGARMVILRGGYFNAGFKGAIIYRRNPVSAASVRSQNTGCRCVVGK